MAESVIFYESFFRALQTLDDADRLAAYDAIVSYGITGEDPEVDGVAKGMFLMAKPQIDANTRRRENGEKGAEYGRLGGRPKKENPKPVAEENPNGVIEKNPLGVTGETPKEKVKDKEKDKAKEKDREKRASAFTPPTVEEVRAYCQERHNDVNPEKWWDFYQSKNWMIGNNKMKDWKAAVRTWEQRDSRAAPAKKPSYPQRSYDFAEMERQLIKN